VNTLLKLALAGIVIVAPAAAQGRGGGGRGGNSGPGTDVQVQPVISRLQIIADLFKLSKDQKKEVKAILDEGQKDANPIREEMVKDRLAIGEAVAGGKSQEEIDKATQAYGTQMAQMTAIELKCFAKIVDKLEPEQKDRASRLYAMIPGIFKGKNWDTP
jgi:hypothetical protein